MNDLKARWLSGVMSGGISGDSPAPTLKLDFYLPLIENPSISICLLDKERMALERPHGSNCPAVECSLEQMPTGLLPERHPFADIQKVFGNRGFYRSEVTVSFVPQDWRRARYLGISVGTKREANTGLNLGSESTWLKSPDTVYLEAAKSKLLDSSRESSVFLLITRGEGRRRVLKIAKAYGLLHNSNVVGMQLASNLAIEVYEGRNTPILTHNIIRAGVVR